MYARILKWELCLELIAGLVLSDSLLFYFVSKVVKYSYVIKIRHKEWVAVSCNAHLWSLLPTTGSCNVCMQNAWHILQKNICSCSSSAHIIFSFHTQTPLVHNIDTIYDYQLYVWVSSFQDGIREHFLKFSFQFSSLLKPTTGSTYADSPSKVNSLLNHLAKLGPHFCYISTTFHHPPS